MQQSTICDMHCVKRKLVWDDDQLVLQKVAELQCALQQQSAEVAELQAQLASLRKTKIRCLREV